MKTIERMAELLGPMEWPNSKPSTPDEKGSVAKLDAIEREVTESTGHSEFPRAGERIALQETEGLAVQAKAKARPAGRISVTTRTLRVDRDQLHRQSLISPDGQRTPNAENFRRIKRQILANVAKSKAGAPANLVMVSSALPGEGKTFCATNLAISMALEMDRTVLLVDADVARPSFPRALGLKAEQGLLDVLLDSRIGLAQVLWKTDIGRLALLPVGKAHHHATELLASDMMRSLLQEMAERYHDRIIIFDSPPLLVASEAGVLASQMGQIVLVVEAGKTSEAVLKAALGRIDLSNVTGLLLNKGADSWQRYDYGGYG